MAVRAKFRCMSETNKKWGPDDSQVSRSYEFMAVYDETTEEDRRFARSTPSGNLTIQVDNPAVSFQPGQTFYLDFTPVEEENV